MATSTTQSNNGACELTTDGARDRISNLKFVGLLFAPPPEANRIGAMKQQLEESLSRGGIEVRSLRMSPPPVLPVFEDPRGRRFVLLPDTSGRPLALMIESENSEIHAASRGGGLALLDPDRLEFAEPPAVRAIRAAAADLIARRNMESALAPENRDQRARREGVPDSVEAAGMVLGYGPSVMKLLAGSTNLNMLTQGVAQLGIGQLFSLGTQKLLGDLLTTGPDASLASQLGAMVGKQVVGELQSMCQGWVMDQIGMGSGQGGLGGAIDGYQKRIETVFSGIDASVSQASIPVGRVGDPNSAAGTVAKGSPTVLVNQIPAARLSDLSTMSSPDSDAGPIVSGNPTVLVDGLPLAGLGHIAIGTGKGVVGAISSGSGSVFMSPAGMPAALVVAPPPSADTGQASGASSGKSSAAAGAGSSSEAGSSEAGDPAESPRSESGQEAEEAPSAEEASMQATSEVESEEDWYGKTPEERIMQDIAKESGEEVAKSLAGQVASYVATRGPYLRAQGFSEKAINDLARMSAIGDWLERTGRSADPAWADWMTGTTNRLKAEYASAIHGMNELDGVGKDAYKQGAAAVGAAFSAYDLYATEQTIERLALEGRGYEALTEMYAGAARFVRDTVFAPLDFNPALGVGIDVATNELFYQAAQEASYWTFDPINDFSHWLYEQDFWPKDRPPRFPRSKSR